MLCRVCMQASGVSGHCVAVSDTLVGSLQATCDADGRAALQYFNSSRTCGGPPVTVNTGGLSCVPLATFIGYRVSRSVFIASGQTSSVLFCVQTASSPQFVQAMELPTGLAGVTFGCQLSFPPPDPTAATSVTCGITPPDCAAVQFPSESVSKLAIVFSSGLDGVPSPLCPPC